MILLLLGCSGQPEDALTWQEEYELLVLNADANIIDLRFSVSNTGTLKGMGHARGEIARKKESSIRLGFDAWPDEMEHDEGVLRIGPDYLEKHGDDWQVLFREGDELEGYRDLRMSLESSDVKVAPIELDGWTIDPIEVSGVASGVLAASGRQRILRGPAVLTHRSGDAPPAMSGEGRVSIHVVDDGVSIAAERLGDRTFGWVLLDGELHDGLEPKLAQDKRKWTLDYRPALDLVVTVAERKPESETDPWEHLSGVERKLAGAGMGEPSRRVSVALASWETAGAPRSALALVVEVQVE
ncbi:MAG: hypothetical protein GY913_26220 [Proteobacteria bacterium]|nr:hypothetical protein [Pseudomonadota bacterium]MCP4920413.1 hypothetical protein [Pseudomonadota bacterium]